MSDKPILFSGPMVRALLAGTKTQTRRALNPQPQQWKAKVIDVSPPSQDDDGNWGQVETVWSGPLVPGMCEPDHEEWHPIRHHRVGDRLYVREAWRCNGWATDVATVMYRASEGDGYTAMTEQYPVAGKKPMRVTGTWRPGIHMPRWASRITLTVTDVRVERLQDISEADALAEGVKPWPLGDNLDMPGFGSIPAANVPAKTLYCYLWEHINGSRSWAANPWVAAYTFSVAMGNIDQVEK